MKSERKFFFLLCNGNICALGHSTFWSHRSLVRICFLVHVNKMCFGFAEKNRKFLSWKRLFQNMCILCILMSNSRNNSLEKQYPKELPPLNLTFFLPGISLEGDHELKMLKQLVDHDTYKFLPAQVSFLFFAEKKKEKKKKKKNKKKKKKKK